MKSRDPEVYALTPEEFIRDAKRTLRYGLYAPEQRENETLQIRVDQLREALEALVSIHVEHPGRRELDSFTARAKRLAKALPEACALIEACARDEGRFELVRLHADYAKLRVFVEQIAGGEYRMTDMEGAQSDAQVLLTEIEEDAK